MDRSVDQLVPGPEVSFVIPCLNEAESLAVVIDEIHASYSGTGLQYEIVVADNGSTDGSQAIARDHHAVVVEVTEKGYGAALIGGITHSRGQYVVMGDADGSYTFGDARAMIPLLREGAEVVMGNRFTGGIAPGAMPVLHKYVGNPVLSWLGRLFFGVPVGDFHSGLRAFSRERIGSLGLTSPGMEFASELLVRAQKAGFRIEEVPVTLKPDLRSRRPHLRTWRDGWRHLRFLLLHSPRWAFLVPACLVGVLALVVLALAILGPVTLGSIEFSYRTSIVASALALVAAIAAWSAYLARVTLADRVQRRRIGTEVMAAISAIVTLGGGTVILSQLISWQGVDFGHQPAGQDLLATIGGSFFLALGGMSFFFSLLVGLVRNVR